MRNVAVLTAVALAALVVVTAQADPAHAAQSTVAVSNSGAAVDTVVGTGSAVPAQLVMRGGRAGGGRAGGGRAFRAGGVRSFHAGGFNRVRFGHRRFIAPYFYGPVYNPYYDTSYNDCFWDGYQWVCEEDLY